MGTHCSSSKSVTVKPQSFIDYRKSPRSAQNTSSSQDRVESPSRRPNAAFREAAISAYPSNHQASARVPSSRHAVSGSPASSQDLAQSYQSNRSSGFVQAHDALLDQLSLLRLQIEGLEALNAQSYTELSTLNAPHYVPTTDGEEYEQIFQLTEEIRVRHEEIDKRHQIIASTKEALQAHGLCVDQLPTKTCFVEGPEDEEGALCQFCVSNPIDVLFTCCNYRGACQQCLGAMRKVSPKCPNCRAQQPEVIRDC